MWTRSYAVQVPTPRKDSPSQVQALVAEALDRLEAEHDARGERLVMRRLELAHGVSNGTTAQLLKGSRAGVSASTAKRLEKMLGIPWRSLVWEGKAPRDDDGDDAAPASATCQRRDDITGLEADLDAAFVDGRHKPSDAQAAREVYARIPVGPDRVARLRTWLDVAARLRVRGERATPEAIFDELTRLVSGLGADVTRSG